MTNQRRQRIIFTASKIVSKPATISFQTKSGKIVEFKGHKDVPKSVQINFLAKFKK